MKGVVRWKPDGGALKKRVEKEIQERLVEKGA